MNDIENPNGSSPALPARRRRVCLVTVEFHGLFRNGGIGTANTALAVALAENGFDVTVAVANADDSGPRLTIGNFAELRTAWGQRGITLDYVRPHPQIAGSFDDPRTASYCVFLYVQRGGFDVVLFNDNGGQGFYSLLAKHTGVFPNPPLMYVVAHGPLDWVHELNSLEYYSVSPVLAAHMERRSAALADILISPSRYLLDWMIDRKWVPPGHGRVVQNLLGLDELAPRHPDSASMRPVSEIVFFGRQEIRKGITLFCDALDLLDQASDLSSVTVTFLGKFSRVGAVHTGVYVAERARQWRAQPRILAVYDQGEAVHYLQRPGVLAVIPSRTENSPCVVAESLQLGLLFLATNTGGTPELLEPQDRERCLFPPNPAALAQRLGEVLRSGHRPARLAIPPARTRAEWISLLSNPPKCASAPAPAPAPRAVVSACLIWSGSRNIQTCIDSLRRQSYAELEIIVVAAGAESARPNLTDAVTQGVKVHFCEYESPGAALNVAAQVATGEYLLFVDETVAALLPDSVSTLVGAARRTCADIVTGIPDPDNGSGAVKPNLREWELPVGACEEAGAVENCFGEGALLISTATFTRSKGFAVDCNRHLLHWLFLAGAVLAGAVLEVVPVPVMQLRVDSRRVEGGERTVEDHRRVMQLYRDAPIRTISRITESMLRVQRKNLRKLEQALQGVSPIARDLAVRLSSIDANCTEAFRAFVSYCLERRMVDLAIDFTVHNDVTLLPDTAIKASRFNEAAAFDLIRTQRLDLRHTINLTAEVSWRSQPFYGLGANDLQRLAGGALQHRVPIGHALVKVTGACPPGTVAVRIAATTDAAGPVQLCCVLCQPWSRPTLSRDGMVSDGSAWWSGWKPASEPQTRTQVTIRLPQPLTELLDLYLATLYDALPQFTAISVSWTEIKADVCMVGRTTPSAIALGTETTPLPPEYLKRGELLTDTSEVTFKVYVPEDRTLLHPVPGRLALVRLADALPQGSTGLRCIVSVENEKAHPIEFATWARPATAPLSETNALEATENFSGWLRMDTPFVKSCVSLAMDQPAVERMDIYLATRVVESDNVDFCHAFWHDFTVVGELIRKPEAQTAVSAESISAAAPQQVESLPCDTPALHSDAFRAETLRGSYLICGSARTGTDLLAAGLRATKLAGWPLQYFNTHLMNDVNILARLGLEAAPTDPPGFESRLDHIVRSGTAGGIFATAVHWWDLQNLLAAIASRLGQEPPSTEYIPEELRTYLPALRTFLPEPRFIWIRRQNKVAQAISHYIALQTGEWSRLRESPAPSPSSSEELLYDFSAISQLVYNAELEEKAWREFLAEVPEATLELTYEEIAADYAEVVARVMAFIGVPLARDQVPPPEFVRQANSRSLEWEERFRSDFRGVVVPAAEVAVAVQAS